MRKKLLIITDAWQPQVNGVVTVIRETLKLLPEEDFETEILHPGLFFNIPVPFYPEIRFAPFGQGFIKKRIQEFKPDHIHIETESAVGLAGRQACIALGLSFTTAYHTHFPLYFEVRTGLSGKWIYSYLAWFHSAAVRTMVSSESLKQELKDHGFEHLMVRPLGVDTKLFVPKNSLAKRTTTAFVFLGRIAVEKGIEDFLRAELPGEKWIIGDGPLKEEYEKSYPDAHFFGYKSGQELVDILSSADVLVMPSKTETFGLVAIEAMACGLSVAAYPAPGPSYIIQEGVNGSLDEDIARAAIRSLSIDRNKCRETARMYSWENSAKIFRESIVDVYKK